MAFVPSKYQEEIFKWMRDPQGSLSVDAKAGAAKTTTAVMGMSMLPGKLYNKLFAAFNKSIVDELKKKLPQSVTCQTMHSLGYAALRAGVSGVRKWDLENGNTKYRYMARDIRVEPQYGDKKAVQDALLSLLNFAQLTMTPLDVDSLVEMAERFNVELPSTMPLDQACEIVKGMLEHGRSQAEEGLISFSDMIYMPLLMELNIPKYDFIALDECQDLNKAQMTLMARAMAKGGNMLAVGDPNQAIYGFAGAEADSFFQVRDHFKAASLPLNFCYRCPESVIKEAQKIVPGIEAPPNTRVGIVDTITEENFKQQLRRGDMVLCRTTAPLINLCFELISRRIQAKVKARYNGASMANTIRTIMKREQDVKKFPGLAQEYLISQLAALRQRLGSESAQESVTDRVECLQICYTSFEPRSVEDFTRQVSDLFADDGKSPITLCTVHRAKGLENPRVFIIKPEKLPLIWKNQSPTQMQQEMNLRYVAITRAQEELYFVESAPEGDGMTMSNPGIPGISV